MGIIKVSMISFILISLFYSFLYFPATNLSSPPTASPSSSTSTAAVAANNHLLRGTYPVKFAYLISASRGDSRKVMRLLKALYHPGNYYLIHLDSDAPPDEHRRVSDFVAGEHVFRAMGNVWMVRKPNLVTYRGPTMLATTLHAMAILLRTAKWDWFINLSASDYPLVTQDDLIDAFSGLPRNLNFIQHSSRLGWKLNKRAKPIIIDPGLYSNNKSEIWWVIKQRPIPTSFKLYTGSAWTILSRSFAEYSILGYENLPRNLLLYYTNFVSSPEGYFQTLICNSPEFRNTTANHDLHYITWDNPPKQHPRYLTLKDYRRMILSARPFARKFKRNDPVLDRIDRELLRRSHNNGNFGYGGWCLGSMGGSVGGKRRNGYGGCPSMVDIDRVRYGPLAPGPGSRRLRSLIGKLVSDNTFVKRQCR